MGDPIKLGIIICDRYWTCGGGKCLRALRNREGAFERYKETWNLSGFPPETEALRGNVQRNLLVIPPQEIPHLTYLTIGA
jgi:hypothetical protein